MSEVLTKTLLPARRSGVDWQQSLAYEVRSVRPRHAGEVGLDVQRAASPTQLGRLSGVTLGKGAERGLDTNPHDSVLVSLCLCAVDRSGRAPRHTRDSGRSSALLVCSPSTRSAPVPPARSVPSSESSSRSPAAAACRHAAKAVLIRDCGEWGLSRAAERSAVEFSEIGIVTRSVEVARQHVPFSSLRLRRERTHRIARYPACRSAISTPRSLG